MALVEQPGDDRWYVQPAAIWHWYLPLCINNVSLGGGFVFVLCLFFSFFFNEMNLVLINEME